jgi:hypothetical protein
MKLVISFLTVSMVAATPFAFAGHDHGGGGHDSGGHTPSQSQADVQGNKVSEELLKSCAQHVDSIQRNIVRLQAKVAENRAASTINGELEKLEQLLKEAKETVRALQVF